MDPLFEQFMAQERLEPLAPGLYPDIPAPRYHLYHGASASRLKKLSRSPAHLLLSLMEPQGSTASMETGTIVHARVLEPDRFSRDYVSMPKWDLRTNKGKAAKEAFELDNLGKQVISEADAIIADGAYDSIMQNPDIRVMLESEGPIECSMFWNDPETDIYCKSRMDKRPEISGQKIILDVKTTGKDASLKGFAKDIANFQYHIQAALYLDGIQHVTGEEHLGFAFLAIETNPPYPFGLYLLDEQSIQAGRNEYKRLLNLWKKCFTSGNFPHYTDNLAESALQEISLPSWALREYGV